MTITLNDGALWLDDQPFLVLAGELGNSTASDLATLRDALVTCRQMRLNTVLLPVCWDLIEPAEGVFDFALVRGAIDLARSNDLRLIYLWFGTWKNGMSCYAPAWMKQDTRRFPRVRRRDGTSVEVISPACAEAASRDARAFAELMRFTATYDRPTGTVIMAQVENEIGLMPDARDHSDPADRVYRDAVPDALLDRLSSGKLGPEIDALWRSAGRQTHGSWLEVFGDSPQGDEVFSAWLFATYVERVASAGKAAHPIPLFTNAALIRPGYEPGRYPAAGPLPHLLELWQLAAPSLEMICPDIYFPNFVDWASRYVRSGNPLFVPEMAPSTRASGNALYAIGQLRAMGVAPFAIEDLVDLKARLLSELYDHLASLAPLLHQARKADCVRALSPVIDFDWNVAPQVPSVELAGVRFEARFDKSGADADFRPSELPTLGPGRWETPPGVPLGATLILQLDPHEFILLGMGSIITFHPADGHGHVGIESAQEGRFDPTGRWVGGRWLNGDQTHQGRHIHLYDGRWSIQRVRLYRYD